MSIMFADDFRGYGNDSSLLANGLWGVIGGDYMTDDPDPNAQAGSKTLRFQSFGNSARRPFTVGAVAVAGCALRLWMPALPSFTTACIRFLDGGNNLQANLAITPTGVIELYYGSVGHGGVLLASSIVPVLTANSFHHVEFKVLCDPAAGTVEARVDGNLACKAMGVNTGTALQLGLGTTNDYNGTASRVDYIKDLVCWNGLGGHNTDFLGTVSVVGLTPDSDVSLGWTPTPAGPGWSLLNRSPPADGVDFITAPYPPPAPSIFGMMDLPVNVTSVRALISQVRARKADGGDGNLQSSLISAGVSVSGADRPLTTAFTYYEDVFETDPNTAASWTPAATNLATLKLNRTV